MSKQSGFDESEAKRIIARAAEIDVQRQQSLDVNAIRDIAAQAGISPASVDKALEEHQVSPTSLRARLMRRPGLMVGTVILAVYLLLRLME